MESRVAASPMYPVDAMTPFLEGAARAEAERRRSRDPPRRTPRQPLRGAARFLRRASGRGLMLREPSVRVREAAAQQLEERQSDWAYSKPVIALDMLWNAAFVGIAIAVLSLSAAEDPSVPLRVWIVGYAFQCAVHMACVVAEYRRRQHEARSVETEATRGWESGGDLNSGSGSDTEEYAAEEHSDESGDGTSLAKNLESANTMFSFIWWIAGFYWVTAGGDNLVTEAPQLYWLCVLFLAFDVVFVMICVAVACLIGIAICCCLPCIIAILYVVADQEGATKEDIDRLPKFKFRKLTDVEKVNGEIQESYGGVMIDVNTDPPTERILSQEDAECCICLSAYDDGAELHELPCHHHFHCTCIDKWLHINAICPLCKYNILKPSGEEGTKTEEQQSLTAQKLTTKGSAAAATNNNKDWLNYTYAGLLIILGTAITVALGRPLVMTLVQFSFAANIPSFLISYFVIPLAISIRQALGSISSAKQKTEKAISLALSEIYNRVFMNNMTSLAVFLALVYIRNVPWDVSAEVLVVLVICVLMGLYTSFNTKFPVSTSIVAFLFYPISLRSLYVLTSLLGWT